MSYDKESRLKARTLFVNQRLPLRAIASEIGIPYQTVQRWKHTSEKAGDSWERAKAANRMASGSLGDITAELLEDFSLLFQATLKQVKSDKVPPLQKAEAIARLADAYHKTMSAASKGNPELSELSIALDVLRQLSAFIQQQFPQYATAFVEIIEPFSEHISTGLKK